MTCTFVKNLQRHRPAPSKIRKGIFNIIFLISKINFSESFITFITFCSLGIKKNLWRRTCVRRQIFPNLEIGLLLFQLVMGKYRYLQILFSGINIYIDITIHIAFSYFHENLFLNLGQYFLNTYSSAC